MKKFAIENTSGQWWTGECWGAKEARETYSRDEAPDELPVSNYDDYIKMRSYEDVDTCFYYDESGSEDDGAVASLVEVD
jgi:hypothetical protein